MIGAEYVDDASLRQFWQLTYYLVEIRYKITKNWFNSAILQVNVCYFGNFLVKIEYFCPPYEVRMV